MDLLSGVGGCCSSTAKVNNIPRRDSSISLEESAYKCCPPEHPLVPFKHRTFQDQQEDSPKIGCPLPLPSLPSTSSVVAPMDVYLRSHENLQARLIRLSAILDQSKQTSEPESMSPSPETSSWEIVDSPITASQQVPATPVLQPTPGPKTTVEATDSDIEVVDKLPVSSDSSMSDLLLSDAPHTDSDSAKIYEEAVAKYFATSKRTRYTTAKAPGEKAHVYKPKRCRKHYKGKDKGKGER